MRTSLALAAAVSWGALIGPGAALADEPVSPGEAALPSGNEPAPAAKPDLQLPQTYALGARVRYLFVPNTFFAPYLQAATQLNSASLGIEFIYRKPAYDVVTSLDFSFVSPDDGNYLSNGHDPASDTHYVQFRDLNFLSIDVSIIGHHTWASVPWLELRYGAGLGLGAVLGDVLLTNNWDQCTAANASDIRACHPLGVDLTSPNKEAQLKATEQAGATDTAQTPHRHVSQDKPPVMAVVNILVGVLFRVHPHASLSVELGFRDAMFLGVGGHYWF